MDQNKIRRLMPLGDGFVWVEDTVENWRAFDRRRLIADICVFVIVVIGFLGIGAIMLWG